MAAISASCAADGRPGSRATLQPGNTVGLVWRARLDEHLGAYAVEPLDAAGPGRLMGSALALAGINYLAALMRVLPERDPHEALYEAASLIADALDEATLAPALIARFEARILAECGFRLDLCPLRRDRRDRSPRLCLAQVGQGGERRGRGAVARPAAAAARLSCARTRRSRRSRARTRSPTPSG